MCAPQSATPTSSSAIKDGLTYGRGLIGSLLFAFAYKQLRCLLNGSARQRGARQQSPRDALNQIRPRVTKALAIPSSWMSVVVMSQKHSMP